jgi:hypothetical protein
MGLNCPRSSGSLTEEGYLSLISKIHSARSGVSGRTTCCSLAAMVFQSAAARPVLRSLTEACGGAHRSIASWLRFVKKRSGDRALELQAIFAKCYSYPVSNSSVPAPQFVTSPGQFQTRESRASGGPGARANFSTSLLIPTSRLDDKLWPS